MKEVELAIQSRFFTGDGFEDFENHSPDDPQLPRFFWGEKGPQVKASFPKSIPKFSKLIHGELQPWGCKVVCLRSMNHVEFHLCNPHFFAEIPAEKV